MVSGAQVEQQQTGDGGEDPAGPAGRADARAPSRRSRSPARPPRRSRRPWPTRCRGTGPRASRYSPGSVSTKAIGARNAGSAYLSACHIVGHGAAAGDRARPDRGERGRRGDLGEHRVVEDEHRGGRRRDAELQQRRADDHPADDEARGDRHGQAQDREREGGQHHGQREHRGRIVGDRLGPADQQRGQLGAEAGLRRGRGDDARRGADRHDREHPAYAGGERDEQPPRRQPGAPVEERERAAPAASRRPPPGWRSCPRASSTTISTSDEKW